MTRVVLIPGVLALLPEYASIEDPVAELRAAVVAAVGWLGDPVQVLAGDRARRVGEWAVARTRTGRGLGSSTGGGEASYVVVGNGSAKRSTEAPGYLDERAAAFDAGLGRCLKVGASESLADIDVGLATELWADVEGIVAMAGLATVGPADVVYEDDPFGVQYWVMRWQCAP